MKLDFQKWITCRKDFQNFEQKNFHFPNGGSNSKFDHPYILEKQFFFETTFVHFRCVSPILDSKVDLEIQLLSTYGVFDTKKWLFFDHVFSTWPTCSYFFIQKTRQNEVTYCENDIKKIFKKWKNHEIFVTILLHVTQIWQ